MFLRIFAVSNCSKLNYMFFDAGHETSGHGTKQIVSRLAVSSLILYVN
jgi:hypothetical protein